jgi:hypothetical protein
MKQRFTLRILGWLHRIWQDLQPTPERLSKALRMTFSSVVVLVLMLVLQMPYVAYDQTPENWTI